jgi:osmoprotectant transport system substrate-binding protein
VPALALRALIAAAVLACAGCTVSNPLDLGDSGDDETITIGALGSAENEILAQIYGQVLEAQGYSVTYDTAIGTRATYLRGLANGSIDMVAEYSTALLRTLDPNSTAVAPNDVVAALAAPVDTRGLTVLHAAPGQNSEALVVTASFAEANLLTSISDLSPIADTLFIAAKADFETQWFSTLASTYGVEGLTLRAIDDVSNDDAVGLLLDNTVQLMHMQTSDPRIAENELTVLDDPDAMFDTENVIPLLSEKLSTPEVATLLDAVTAKLTTEQLQVLNGLYAGEDRPTAAAVAALWLTENDLLT